MRNSLPLLPKSENEHKGYFFSISDEAIYAHRNRSVEDIFNWLESANRFVYAMQTPEERHRSQMAKTIHHIVS
jgi:hypothetical protein